MPADQIIQARMDAFKIDLPYKLFKNRSGHHRAVAFSRPLKHERRIE